MKKQAEQFLIDECPNLRPVIIRPGKVIVRSLLNTLFEYGYRLNYNYSDMYKVTEVIANEMEHIYKENSQGEESREEKDNGHILNTDPVIIGWDEIREVFISREDEKRD